jgi:ubiquinone biosynthesis protein UbiJ
LGLATADDPAATLINSNLEIIGNSAPLIALQQIITHMDIDWEAPLVNLLGDVAGHQLAQMLRSVFGWGQGAGKSLRRQLSEFILEEGRLSPPKAELEYFYSEVQSLSLRVDRLQSRLARLAKRLNEKT